MDWPPWHIHSSSHIAPSYVRRDSATFSGRARASLSDNDYDGRSSIERLQMMKRMS